jgi:hypothetical protein
MGPTDRERIEALRAAGRLSEAEAREIASAVERIDGGRAGARAQRPARTGLAWLKARFLRGEVEPEVLRSVYRSTAVRMGALFGVLMAVVMGLMQGLDGDGPFRWSRALPQIVGHLCVGGPLFGLVMYRVLLRPQAEKLIRLVAETGAPLEPLPATRPGQCPTCGAENSKVWDRSHIAMLHWVLNPGLVVNELVLGQRVPERVEFCRECGTQFVRCEGCGESVDGTSWSVRDQLGNWGRDLACPECGHAIPCLRNGWAAAIEWIFRRVLYPRSA